MQTHAPRKAGGRPERRLLRQSSHDMDVPVLRKPGRGCERHSRLCVRACVLSAAVFCVAYPMAAVVVQRLVDDAELTVQTFILKDPEESSIYVDVVGGALSMITLPLQTSLDDLRFTLLVGNSTVGQMSAGIIPLGYGGSAPIDLDGRLNITDHSGFRQLSEAVIRHETVGLSIDGIATVRAGWLGLRFRNVRVAKHVEMRGANGLAVRIRRFELLDSPARQVGVADVTPEPLHLEMEVRQSPHPQPTQSTCPPPPTLPSVAGLRRRWRWRRVWPLSLAPCRPPSPTRGQFRLNTEGLGAFAVHHCFPV
eukprot:scaffold5010_cov110-Isochrysis_galbana.AAC.2